jgi:phage terminase large subunit-like protein
LEKDRRFGLPRFWERTIRRIYGPRHPDGRRVVRTVFIMIPRGARKTTTIGGGLGLLHSVGFEKVPMGQVLLGAGSEDQAEFAFDEAVSMVRATPKFQRNVKVRGDYLEHPEFGSQLKVLTAEGDLSHGSTPAAVFLDELHVLKNRKLWRALKTGMVKSPGGLLVITTTAGRGQTGLAWEEYQYARRVALGEIENPAYLAIILEPPAGADWQDEELWHLVNPGLAEGFPVLDEMRQAALEAREKPAERDDFKQFNLNFWLDRSLSPFVEMAVYDEGSLPVDVEKLRDQPCWIAVDLGLNTDLTAVVACWRDGDDGYAVAAWFFCPEDNLQGRADRDKVPYPRWAEEGFIIPTPGNVTDYRAVEQHLRSLCDQLDVREIAFDPAYAQAVMGPLTEDGYPTATMRQGWFTMAPAIKELERAIIGRRFRHGGHPVLRWCFENVSIETDRAGNKSFHKGKSRDRIDGAVAAAMAVARASTGDSGRSIFDQSINPQDFLVAL